MLIIVFLLVKRLPLEDPRIGSGVNWLEEGGESGELGVVVQLGKLRTGDSLCPPLPFALL